jgi:protein ImuB
MAIQAEKRAMFVWLPNFAMTRARLKRPPLAKPHEPLVLLEKHGTIRRIAALDGPAIGAGLYLHQPLADALAVLPTLIAADAEPEADREALTALALWAQRYSPFTAAAHPDGLWLDVTGCAHLWGGEDSFTEDMLARLEARGIPARAAIAPTHGSAFALAHHADPYVIVQNQDSSCSQAQDPLSFPRKRKSPLVKTNRAEEWIPASTGMTTVGAGLKALLGPLPVERLRISNETANALRKLGLFTIGSVQNLPRAGLSRRFPDLLPQLDKALGLAAETIDFLRPPTPWIERLRFPEPISSPDDLERAAAGLLDRVCARLELERQGGLSFEVSFFRADGGVQSQSVSTALPTRDAKRVMRLFREKLGFIDPGFGIDGATLHLSHVEPLEIQQSGLLREGYNAACVEELAALIDALENRLGGGRVYRLELQESYIPERAVKKAAPIPSPKPSLQKRGGPRRNKHGFISPAEKDRMKDSEKLLGERPIRLFQRPHPIDVTAALPDAPPMLFRWRRVLHRVIRAEGPERISPEWWRGDQVPEEDDRIRDYYRVENAQGLRFWVFREGVYGGERLPRWYLHGVFA